MPQRDGAAVAVDARIVGVQPQLLQTGQHLYRKRLVDFDDIHLRQ